MRVSQTIVTRSGMLAENFLKFDSAIPDAPVRKDAFCTPAHWALYWCIASASSFVCGDASETNGENGRTATFHAKFERMMEYVGDKLGDDAQIDIALSTLWSVNDPAYKEGQ
jgi:hypothetical protein